MSSIVLPERSNNGRPSAKGDILYDFKVEAGAILSRKKINKQG